MPVDAHHHLWDLAITPQPWIDPTMMAAINRSFDVADLTTAVGERAERTVCVQTVNDADETRLLLQLADNHSIIGAVVGWVDLTAVNVADQLDVLVAGPGGRGLSGIRHQVQHEPDPRWLCQPDVQRGLASVGARGLVYELLVLPHQLSGAIDCVAQRPDVMFVLDHLGKPPLRSGDLTEWETNLRRLATHPNVRAKVSGLVTEAEWTAWNAEMLRPCVEVALDAFGPDRLMLGSDWPVCLLAGSCADVWAAQIGLLSELSSDERAAMTDTTARATYRSLGMNGPSTEGARS
jgi:L-fuconolactonase